jgi:hypothetical protein
MDSTEQLKAWAKMIAATSAISFVVGATAALVANRYTGHREVNAPSFTNKTPGIQLGSSPFAKWRQRLHDACLLAEGKCTNSTFL